MSDETRQTDIDEDVKQDFIWRKSYPNEDSRKCAEHLDSQFDIDPYTVDDLSDLIKAGSKSGEFTKEPEGNTKKIVDLEEWFENRVLPNTVSVAWDDYMDALSSSFELLTLGEVAKTDFGSSRQREFGQLWTDFSRGFLGEIIIKKFFQNRFGEIIDLEQREVGDVEDYLPSDVTRIKKDGEWTEVEGTLSIKTSKLKAMWLGIPQNEYGSSSAYTFVKMGIPLTHLATYLKEADAISELLERVDKEDKRERIKETIPDFEPIPAYIPGFAWSEDFEEGDLEVHKANIHAHIEGGIGERPEEPPEGYESINTRGPDMSEEYISGTGVLRWEKEDWMELVDLMKP